MLGSSYASPSYSGNGSGIIGPLPFGFEPSDPDRAVSLPSDFIDFDYCDLELTLEIESLRDVMQHLSSSNSSFRLYASLSYSFFFSSSESFTLSTFKSQLKT